MISHKYRCIFIHIPKCAGTSIERALGHLDDHLGRHGQDHRTIRRIERPFLTPAIFSSADNILEAVRRVRYQYRPHKNIKNKITVAKEQYRAYFKFSFVRNPWARAYSWYQNVLRDDVHQHDLKIASDISLNEFLKMFAGKGMLRPQTHWLKNFRGSIPLDYIGKFENLKEDFDVCCQRMNINPIMLPREQRGSGIDYRDAYDANSIDIIGEIYGEEIENFGYSFSESANQRRPRKSSSTERSGMKRQDSSSTF